MKLSYAPDDLGTMLFHRQVSENGLVEIGVYRVAYGWRVRAGFVGEYCCVLDWCGGGNWKDVERLYSLCYAILSDREESRDCFEGIPPHSTVKPFYLDLDFVKIVGRLAGDFNLMVLDGTNPKTNQKFKVGDKVHVDPGEYTRAFKHYIRATITEIDEVCGYRLRAFQQDLPGIYMFNIWDKDLSPRTGRSRKYLSSKDK